MALAKEYGLELPNVVTEVEVGNGLAEPGQPLTQITEDKPSVDRGDSTETADIKTVESSSEVLEEIFLISPSLRSHLQTMRQFQIVIDWEWVMSFSYSYLERITAATEYLLAEMEPYACPNLVQLILQVYRSIKRWR